MTVQPIDPAELARRVERALVGELAGARVSNISQIVGGTSSLTYSATLARGRTDERRIVIKVAPPGLEPVRNRDVLRQARMLQLLGSVGGVACPDVLGTDVGAPVEVPPLFVMSFVAGESYEPLLSPVESAATPEEIARRAHAAAAMAGRLHAIDTTDPRLDGERVIDLSAEVGRWAKAFASVGDDLRHDCADVESRLLRSLPESLAPSVLHGDWRLGNMQCNGPAIDAVIDWEIWSLGDRRLDLAWFLLLLDDKHPNRIRPSSGLPDKRELVAAYEAASGVAIDGLGWFDALVRYKQAAASALIVKNNRKLHQPGVDVDRMQATIPLLLDWARDLVAEK